MTENSKVHLNIQSRQFNNLKSLLILAKIRNFAFGAVVFGAFVSWGFCLWGFCLLGVLSLGFLSMGLLSVGLLYMGLLPAPRIYYIHMSNSVLIEVSYLVHFYRCIQHIICIAVKMYLVWNVNKNWINE